MLEPEEVLEAEAEVSAGGFDGAFYLLPSVGTWYTLHLGHLPGAAPRVAAVAAVVAEAVVEEADVEEAAVEELEERELGDVEKAVSSGGVLVEPVDAVTHISSDGVASADDDDPLTRVETAKSKRMVNFRGEDSVNVFQVETSMTPFNDPLEPPAESAAAAAGPGRPLSEDFADFAGAPTVIPDFADFVPAPVLPVTSSTPTPAASLAPIAATSSVERRLEAKERRPASTSDFGGFEEAFRLKPPRSPTALYCVGSPAAAPIVQIEREDTFEFAALEALRRPLGVDVNETTFAIFVDDEETLLGDETVAATEVFPRSHIPWKGGDGVDSASESDFGDHRVPVLPEERARGRPHNGAAAPVALAAASANRGLATAPGASSNAAQHGATMAHAAPRAGAGTGIGLGDAGFAVTGAAMPTRSMPAGLRRFQVRVPLEHPGVTYRRTMRLEDRYDDHAPNGSYLDGVVEEGGMWVRTNVPHRTEDVFVPMRLGDLQLLQAVESSSPAAASSAVGAAAAYSWQAGGGQAAAAPQSARRGSPPQPRPEVAKQDLPWWSQWLTMCSGCPSVQEGYSEELDVVSPDNGGGLPGMSVNGLPHGLVVSR